VRDNGPKKDEEEFPSERSVKIAPISVVHCGKAFANMKEKEFSDLKTRSHS